ncbi:MAG: TIGR00725 family protein [Chloroflexota bacterium]|nr:TIGR00725 family protein [Chloroflexota bacterium]
MAEVSPIVAFCGPGEPAPQEWEQAELLGRLIGERGWTLICGGLGGAMEAACAGAKQTGGTTIGILPGYDPAAANSWIDLAICTGMGQARNAIIVATARVVIACGGGFGTLSEIALAQRLRRPVILLGGWAPVLDTPGALYLIERHEGDLRLATTPEEAIAFVDAALATL